MTADSAPVFAVVLAGGSGERFWPLGRRDKPKQFLPLDGREPLLAGAVSRLDGFIPRENVLVMTNYRYAEATRKLVALPPENIISEPEKRDTAPCMALAAGLIRRRAPGADPTMIAIPADQLIADRTGYLGTLKLAVKAAESGALVTIGIPPTEASTGFGYIECGEVVTPGVRRSLGFREKPDAATATAFLAAGNYLWNSGIFIWKLSALTRELQLHRPELAAFTDAVADAVDPDAVIAAEYRGCPKISIDYAIMERAANVLVVDADFDWDDAGNWSALRRRIIPDAAGNSILGNVTVLDCTDSLLLNDDPGHLIGVIGMERVAVIRSGNATLICPLSEAQRVRGLLQQIADKPDGEKFL